MLRSSCVWRALADEAYQTNLNVLRRLISVLFNNVIKLCHLKILILRSEKYEVSSERVILIKKIIERNVPQQKEKEKLNFVFIL